MASPALTKLSIDNAQTEGQRAKANINTARANKNAGGVRQGETIAPPVVPPATTTPVITPASLAPSAAPIVSPAPSLTDTTKLQSDLLSQQEDALAQKNAADLTTATQGKDVALKSYLDQLTAAKGINTLTNEAYSAAGGVDSITPELNAINDKIRQEQRSLDLAKRAITEKGGGLASGALAEQQNLERVSLQKQADLSIIQLAVQGRYDSAKAIADRAVNAQFEEQTKKTEVARFDYQENKDLFTTAEQRQYDMLFADRASKIADAKQNKQDMYNLGLQASADGAPQSVVEQMFAAKTREEALAIGGSYIGALDRAQKLASINASNASAANSSRRQTQIIDNNGVKQLVDTQTGQVISTITGDGSTQDALAAAVGQNNINTINNVLSSKAIGATVGPNAFAQTAPGLMGATRRFIAGALAGGAVGGAGGALVGGIGAIPGAIIGALAGGVTNASRGSMAELSGERQNFVGSVEQVREQLTLDKLVQAKANGATFGALSDGERSMLAASASKLGTWAVKDSNGKVTGYNVNEKDFKKEMDFINNMAKLDQIIKGADPASVGATVQQDGSVWVMNSDGTLTQIK